MKYLFYIFFLCCSVFFLNAQDTVVAANKAELVNSKTVSKSLKSDQNTIEVVEFEHNFKSKYADDEFVYDVKQQQNNIWERFSEWFSNWLSRTFEFEDGKSAQKFLSYLINGIAFLIIVFVVYLIIKSILNKEGQWIFGKNSDKNMLLYDDIENNIGSIDFAKLIQETLNSGNKKFVIRYYYLWVLKKMSDNGIIKWDLEKTNSDYLTEIKNDSDRKNFAYLSYLYNYIWYGNFDVNSTNFDKAVASFKDTIQSLK